MEIRGFGIANCISDICIYDISLSQRNIELWSLPAWALSPILQHLICLKQPMQCISHRLDVSDLELYGRARQNTGFSNLFILFIFGLTFCSYFYPFSVHIFRSYTVSIPRTQWWSGQPQYLWYSYFTIRLFRFEVPMLINVELVLVFSFWTLGVPWWMLMINVGLVLVFFFWSSFWSSMAMLMINIELVLVFPIPHCVHQDRCQVSQVTKIGYLGDFKASKSDF